MLYVWARNDTILTHHPITRPEYTRQSGQTSAWFLLPFKLKQCDTGPSIGLAPKPQLGNFLSES